MPPDVLLVLASSGLTLVASLMFFVSEERPPRLEPRALVSFCIPPTRRTMPPPLPLRPECSVDVSTPSLHGVMTLKPSGEEWIVTLETAPMEDMPAQRVDESGEPVGTVHDLRLHGRAGVARSTQRSWKQKPGRA